MSAKEGIKSFGNKTLIALYNKFLQLHDTSTFHPIKANRLIYKQKKQALQALLLIKEKRDRTIKGRTVANGAQQRAYKSKIELISLTVHSDIFILSAITDVFKKRDIATADIKGAYLHTTMSKFVVVKLTDQ